MNPKILALYLPQFHPIPENDNWWGKGFTEWTNVGKAKKLFLGHFQPRVPADLGYYDLRLPIVREQQVELAREAGVTAFCYWHYWFGNGRRLLKDVFQEVLDSGKPDFPFCLAWANHSWKAVGTTASSKSDALLIEQTYPGKEDAIMHFEFLLKAFKDKRYVKIGGNKPFLLIFNPLLLPDLYIELFHEMAVKEGFAGLYLVGLVSNLSEREMVMKKGYDAVSFSRIGAHHPKGHIADFTFKLWKHLKAIIVGCPPYTYDYRRVYHDFVADIDRENNVIPQLIPQWDHSPRGGRGSVVYTHSSPLYFYKHAKEVLDCIKRKPEEDQIIIIKSWNEWAEGNYMEPDLKFGKGYINYLRKALEECR